MPKNTFLQAIRLAPGAIWATSALEPLREMTAAQQSVVLANVSPGFKLPLAGIRRSYKSL